MTEEFKLLMLSAMYENGGNATHRLLDGHPQMLVYPFESQLGTRLVRDHLRSVLPAKYRWPAFALEATAEEDYDSIIDEELKVRVRTPHVSKFRHVDFDCRDDERRRAFSRQINFAGRSRANIVAAFFRATFESWRNARRGEEQAIFVGYSPAIVVDAQKVLEDFPRAHVLHVVRNPWSAYADTKRRAVPMRLDHYMSIWAMVQHHACVFEQLYRGRLHVLRYEDIVDHPVETLGRVCESIGLRSSSTLGVPSWNGTSLEAVYPWGTIRHATAEANLAAARELTAPERDRICAWAHPFQDRFGYGAAGVG